MGMRAVMPDERVTAHAAQAQAIMEALGIQRHQISGSSTQEKLVSVLLAAVVKLHKRVTALEAQQR